MKQGIHPEYVPTEVVCSCGNTFVTRSTVQAGHITADVCVQSATRSTPENRRFSIPAAAWLVSRLVTARKSSCILLRRLADMFFADMFRVGVFCTLKHIRLKTDLNSA